MSGFRKATCKQAAIKASIYGPAGSGKTFSALLFAEGIARLTGKRIAFVDTETGTQFYSEHVPARQVHPEPFDFDRLETRSITEVHKECQKLNPNEYGVIVVDSISHLWDAAMNAYSGKRTLAGTIPMHAWAGIKKPYKDLMKFLIDSPYHVFILGRQANIFEEDQETGETKAAGVKMRAEGETQYEPHICLRMIPLRTTKEGKKTVVFKEQVISAFAEKDRTGILAGKLIEWPTYENTLAPIMKILGHEQAKVPSDDEAAEVDAEAIRLGEHERAAASKELARTHKARFELAKTLLDLEKEAKKLTPQVKKQFTQFDLAEVRAAYLARENALRGMADPQCQVMPNGEEE